MLVQTLRLIKKPDALFTFSRSILLFICPFCFFICFTPFIALVHKFCMCFFCFLRQIEVLYLMIGKRSKSEIFSVDRTHRDLSTLRISDFYLFLILKCNASNLPKKNDVQNLCTNPIKSCHLYV